MRRGAWTAVAPRLGRWGSIAVFSFWFLQDAAAWGGWTGPTRWKHGVRFAAPRRMPPPGIRTRVVTGMKPPIPLDGETWWPHKFPAKEHCSKCGLCETTFVQNVTEACAFLPALGMSRLDALEVAVHGRSRYESIAWSSSSTWPWSPASSVPSSTSDETRMGVLHQPMQLAKGMDMPHAQWTGVVTSICLAMLESNQVDAVVCIASADDDTLTPQPILARTAADVRRGRGVKPCLAPSLQVLDTIRSDPTIRRLLFCGVGCSVQAFRVIESTLQLESVYVLGTNCADNSPTPQAAASFLRHGVGVTNVSTVTGYEFMTDYRVHVKHTIDQTERYTTRPYFSLPGTIAESSIAKSCLACLDYTNGVADVVVGYMGGPPPLAATDMSHSWQTVTVRNPRGAHMVDTAVSAGRVRLQNHTNDAYRTGQWERLAVATVTADAHVVAMLGEPVPTVGMPIWLGEAMASILQQVGPTGLHFARYSIDYHVLRNYLYVLNHRRQQEKLRHGTIASVSTGDDLVTATRRALPLYAQRLVEFYATHTEFGTLETKIATLSNEAR